MAAQRSPKPLVGVRFPPPEPTFTFKESVMKRYLRFGVPVFVVLVVIFNAIAAYGSDNMPAVYANITALCGWLAIAYDEYLTFKFNRSV